MRQAVASVYIAQVIIVLLHIGSLLDCVLVNASRTDVPIYFYLAIWMLIEIYIGVINAAAKQSLITLLPVY